MFHVAYDSDVKLVAEIDDKDIFAETASNFNWNIPHDYRLYLIQMANKPHMCTKAKK